MPDTLRQCGIVVDIAGDTLAKGVLRVTVGAAHVPESVPAVLLQEVCRAGLTESPLFLPYLDTSVGVDAVTFLRPDANPDIGRFKINPHPARIGGGDEFAKIFRRFRMPADDRIDRIGPEDLFRLRPAESVTEQFQRTRFLRQLYPFFSSVHYVVFQTDFKEKSL